MKPIEGYEGIYVVTRQGEIYSLNRIGNNGKPLNGKLMKTSDNGKGYRKIRLCKNGKVKTYIVHRLVAKAFLPNPNGYPIVNHKNGDKTDNRVENLEWCTHSYNMEHASRIGLLNPIKKLSDADVEIIRNLKDKISCMKLAKQFNVSFQYICAIWKGEKRCNSHIQG